MGASRPDAGGSPDRRPVVALTRARADNEVLRTELERRAVTVVESPMNEVMPPADGGTALRRSLAELTDYRWVVLTSANGVHAVAAARGDTPWPEHVSVAAVGPATSAAATGLGIPVDLVPAVATAASLVASLPSEHGEPGPAPRVLAPLAELASDTVERGLEAKGYLVDRVTAYRTGVPEGDHSGRPVGSVPVDAVAFFSPSAAERYVDAGGDTSAVAICIGPTTADRAVAVGFWQVMTADPHSESGVLAALCRALALGP